MLAVLVDAARPTMQRIRMLHRSFIARRHRYAPAVLEKESR